MNFGYGRCSTNETKQDIDRQINELKKQGADNIFFEYIHGDSKEKPQLSLLLDTVKQGDTIFVLEISRLARSTRQLCDIIDKVKEKQICLNVVGSITVDCRDGHLDPMTNAFVQMSGVFAELELMMIRDRVKSGMANAKAKGAKIGRPKVTKDDIPNLFYKYYHSYSEGLLNITELSKISGITRPTAYKYISLIKKGDRL